MKLMLLVYMTVLGPLFPVADQVPIALDDVCRAIGGGDIDQLVAAMDVEVELSILDREDVYSREEAKAALASFFTQFSPTSFGKVHQGASKSDDAEYCIGTLSTKNGSFRVYVYVAKKSNGVVLQELRFDRG